MTTSVGTGEAVGVSMRARPRSHWQDSHWQGLDGLRALAVIAVVVYHFSPNTLPGGFLGVDIFFGISGYLITRLLAEEFLRERRVNVPRFYRRRARRLLPALALLLAAVSVAALIWRDQLATVRGGVLATAVFGGNWWLAFDHQSYFVSTGRPTMLQHLWSLGVEEQFYLLWPVVVAATLAAGRRATRRRGQPTRRAVSRLSLLAIALALGSTALTWWLADLHNVPYGDDGSLLYYGTETHCMGLLLGAALGGWAAANAMKPRPIAGAWRPEPLMPPRWVSRGCESAGAIALALLALLTLRLTSYSHTLYRGDFLLVGALVVVVIAVATRPGSLVGRALDIRPLRWVGVRSYSIYLWHWPITVVTRPGIDTTMPLWLDQTIRVLLTVGLADASYRLIETPVRRHGLRASLAAVTARLRTQWRRLPPQPGVAAPVALAALVFVGALVIVVGPASPRPGDALDAGQGGRHIILVPPRHNPMPTRTPSPTQSSTQPGNTAPALPKVSGFGDSVLLDAQHALGKVFPGGSIDAVIGRQPDPILADVRKAARKGKLEPLVVLHVGNNGLIDPADLRSTLASLASRRLVLVVTDHLESDDHAWQKPNNATIRAIVPEFPNAKIVDWNAIASAHRGWLDADDLHLLPTGASAYVRILAAAYRANAPRPSPQPSSTVSPQPSTSTSTSTSPAPRTTPSPTATAVR